MKATLEQAGPSKDEVGQAISEGKSAPVTTRVPSAVEDLIFRENLGYIRCKRTLDIVAAVLALVIFTPILVLACIFILIEDGRPVFFRQRRVGRFGKLFVMYKLRTMRKEKCGDRLAPASRFDPRITRVGQWLRRFSVDEIPQLINVLRGDMALVGPRPEMPFVVRKYASWQKLRHLATPGITGLWQVNCRKSVPLHSPEATMLDLDYIVHASSSTDALLLVKTVRTLIFTDGAF
jgi:lipopolysaccharide/colanic/teichoic acid biosynthesis glycosyltransferase